jgi:hypothetical protein
LIRESQKCFVFQWGLTDSLFATHQLHTPPEPQTSSVADFTPEMAAGILGKSLFDPMGRTTRSATPTLGPSNPIGDFLC